MRTPKSVASETRVLFQHEADEKYRAAARWYEERREKLGTDFLDAVDRCLAAIVRFPDAGAPVPHVRPDLGVRRAPVYGFPYQVVYLELRGVTHVLAIAHDRRKPAYWRSRL